jgi:hypothetical protein
LANFDIALDGIREWIDEGPDDGMGFSKGCREGFMDDLLEGIKDLDGATNGIDAVCTSK